MKFIKPCCSELGIDELSSNHQNKAVFCAEYPKNKLYWMLHQTNNTRILPLKNRWTIRGLQREWMRSTYYSKTYLGQGWSSVLGSVGSWDTSAMICVNSLEKDRRKMLNDLPTISPQVTEITYVKCARNLLALDITYGALLQMLSLMCSHSLCIYATVKHLQTECAQLKSRDSLLKDPIKCQDCCIWKCLGNAFNMTRQWPFFVLVKG